MFGRTTATKAKINVVPLCNICGEPKYFLACDVCNGAGVVGTKKCPKCGNYSGGKWSCRRCDCTGRGR
jgi:hypothetical protein